MRRRPDGFTLIEILLALAVLAIGMVGIMALFPVGLDSSRRAIEDTTSANVAESVKAALVQAMRTKPRTTRVVNFSHDGSTTGLTFTLPTGTTTIEIPRDASGGGVAGSAVFRLGQAASAGFPENFDTGDERDASRAQWSFSATLKPHVASGVAIANTYEVEIRIYRNYDTTDASSQLPVGSFSALVLSSPSP